MVVEPLDDGGGEGYDYNEYGCCQRDESHVCLTVTECTNIQSPSRMSDNREKHENSRFFIEYMIITEGR